MTELEPVYATDYSKDVIESRRSGGGNYVSELGPLAPDKLSGQGDLYSIRPTEIGY